MCEKNDRGFETGREADEWIESIASGIGRRNDQDLKYLDGGMLVVMTGIVSHSCSPFIAYVCWKCDSVATIQVNDCQLFCHVVSHFCASRMENITDDPDDSSNRVNAGCLQNLPGTRPASGRSPLVPHYNLKRVCLLRCDVLLIPEAFAFQPLSESLSLSLNL